MEKDQLSAHIIELKDTINKVEKDKEKLLRENENLKNNFKNKHAVLGSKTSLFGNQT
ncbi:MAG: hypothetical protein IPK55_13005 [Streptococcus sp.]|nr:hypothetical protein [Streptococcus sp.]